MAERNVDILIVGGGLAGASCAEGLREERLRRLGRCSSAASRSRPTSARRARRTCCAASPSPTTRTCTRTTGTRSNDIELLTRTSVMKLDPAAQDGGSSRTSRRCGFDRALLATGANINRLRVEGGDHDGIHYLRTLGTAASLRKDAEDAERVVLIGGSYIACEVAASLTKLGKQCTLVMLEDAPLSTGFGDRRRAVLPGAARLARDRVRDRRRGGALRGREARGAGRDGVGQDARRRPRRDRRRRAPRRDAGPQRRARAGGDRRREVLADAGDLGARASGARATRASTTRSSTGGGCASSTSRSPPRRAATRRRR